MNGSPSTVHLFITGRVQRVGYRWYVATRARELGVAGWVRNTRDGAVEVTAQGAPAAIDELLTALWHGPPRAEVEAVHFKEVADPELLLNDPFEIHE